MQHPDEGTIHAWLDGALSADEGLAIEAHLAECADCRAAVIEARGLIAGSTRILLALDSVPGGVLPAAEAPMAWQEPVAIRRTPLWRATGWRAAAAIVLVGSVSWLVTRSNAPADVTAVSPVEVSHATAAGAAAEQMVVASPPPNTGSPNATLSTARRADTALTNARPTSAPPPNVAPPNVPSPEATPSNATPPGVGMRADRFAAVVAQKEVPLAVRTRELARVSAADALERQARSAGTAGGQVAVVATEPNAPAARRSASPVVGMLRGTGAPMGEARTLSAVVSASAKSQRLTGCYALEPSSSSPAPSRETATASMLPAHLELVGSGEGSGMERGTVLAPPRATADAASRVRGEWTSLGANVLELRIADGARSVTATLSVAGDSVTGQARADSGAVTDRRTAAVKGRRTSCKTPEGAALH